MELFELEMLGGSIERRYREMRPEVETMPWGTIEPQKYSPEHLLAARRAWTRAAFQEHRTGAACAATLQSMIQARAPLDLIALAARFPLDEMVHVEMCSRIAMEFGGAVELMHSPEHMIADFSQHTEPFLRATHQVVTFFCVGEALSIPLIHQTAKYTTHPLTKAVLERIVLDEADHGTFGWNYLDWALPNLNEEERQALVQTAEWAIHGVLENWEGVRAQRTAQDDVVHDLGWLGTEHYLELAKKTLHRQVIRPLRERGLVVHINAPEWDLHVA
jgi:hypothetical protein